MMKREESELYRLKRERYRLEETYANNISGNLFVDAQRNIAVSVGVVDLKKDYCKPKKDHRKVSYTESDVLKDF